MFYTSAMASKNETVGSTDAQVRMGEVSVYFLLLIYHRANLRAVTTECENQSTDVRRNIAFGLILPRARRGQLGFSIQDAGIASCVSGPRLAHVFLWYWFDGPGVKKARRGAESEEEHQDFTVPAVPWSRCLALEDESKTRDIYHLARAPVMPGLSDAQTKSHDERKNRLRGISTLAEHGFLHHSSSKKAKRGEAVVESPEITQGLNRRDFYLRLEVPVSENSVVLSRLLVPGFRVLLNHVDAVTVGGADDTGWKVASRSVILPEMVTAMAMPDRGDLRSV
ncbi:hypothetical protein D6C99_04248 [Aureobasidium pullulans]|nr:hypothetical protein D6C99_04248 [Aureobasidium pullulans]